MIAHAGGFFVMTDVKPNRTKVVERDRRDAAGLCVNCGQHPGFDKDGKPKPRRLGDCRPCYDDFTNERDSLSTSEQQAAFTARCVRECKIMPDRQGQRLNKVSDFKAIADEVKS